MPKPLNGRWSLKYDYCLGHGGTDVDHSGRGLCKRCAQNNEIRERVLERFEYADREDGNGMVDSPTDSENIVDELPARPGDTGVDGEYVDPQPESPYVSGEVTPGSFGSPSPTGPGAPPEKRKWWQKKVKSESPSFTPTKEKRPGKPSRPTSGKRVSAADTLTDLWGAAGGIVGRNPAHRPLGRCMQFQAPVAGELLDDAAKGSFVDKMAIQPIVKARGRFDLLGAVFGPPVLVYSIEKAIAAQDQARADMLLALLKSSIRSGLPLMAPAIKRLKAKEAAAAEAARELYPDMPAGEDPVDAIIAEMFSEWTVPPPPETQPESEPANV